MFLNILFYICLIRYMYKNIFILTIVLLNFSCIKETTIQYITDENKIDLELNGLWKNKRGEYLEYITNDKILNLYTVDGAKYVILKYPFFIVDSLIFCNYIYSKGKYKIIGDSLSITINNQFLNYGYKRANQSELKEWQE